MLPRIPVGHQLALGTMRDYRERPLCGGHFKTVNDWLWPISDRFSTRKLSLRAPKLDRPLSKTPISADDASNE